MGNMDRNSLLSGTRVVNKSTKDFRYPLVTTYSNQYQQVKRIMARHWRVLKNGKVLEPHIPEVPQVIFQGVAPLRLQVMSNILDAPNRESFFQNLKGYFPCHKCMVCSLNNLQSTHVCTFSSTATSRNFEINTFISCSSLNVVYLIICPCGLQYVWPNHKGDAS